MKPTHVFFSFLPAPRLTESTYEPNSLSSSQTYFPRVCSLTTSCPSRATVGAYPSIPYLKHFQISINSMTSQSVGPLPFSTSVNKPETKAENASPSHHVALITSSTVSFSHCCLSSTVCVPCNKFILWQSRGIIKTRKSNVLLWDFKQASHTHTSPGISQNQNNLLTNAFPMT